MRFNLNIDKFPFGVNISGFIQSEKGLGAAVRSDIYSLKAARIPYALNNITDGGSVNADKTFNEFSGENPYLFNLVHVNPDVFVRLANDSNRPYFEGHYNIGYWVWELDRFPEEWASLADYLDEIWTPSDFSFQAISKAVNIPVIKIPHCIPAEEVSVGKAAARRGLNISADTFVFLFIFDFQSEIERKNPFAAVEAFKKAFSQEDNAMLFLKTSHSAFNKQKFYELLNAVKGYNITVSDSVFTKGQVYSLMNSCDCYISLHRSEGFGLTMTEAMALGKPVIATGYSGNMDFMNQDNSFPVNYRLAGIDKDYSNFYKRGNYWAEPDVDEAAQYMRYVFDNREEAGAVGNRGKDFIRKFYNPKAIGDEYKEKLDKIMEEYGNVNILNKETRFDLAYQPKVSVCICVYNREQYLEQSIQSALSQDYANIEIIIVDNCSTDGTVDIIKKYLYDERIKFYRNEKNLGLTGNIKQAFKYASGEWVTFLSSDDYWNDPAFISKSIKRVRQSDNITAVCGGVKIVYDEELGRTVDYSDKTDSAFNGRDLFLKGLAALGPASVNFNAVIAKASLAKEYYNGVNDIIVTGGDDYYFWRLCLDGNIYLLREPFLSYRYHKDNASVVKSIDDFAARLIYTAVIPVMSYVAAINKNIIPQIILYKWLVKNIILYLQETFSTDNFEKIKTAYENAVIMLGFSIEKFGFETLFSRLGELSALESRVYLLPDTLTFDDVNKNGFNIESFMKEVTKTESGDYPYLFNNDRIFRKDLIERIKYYLESVGTLNYDQRIRKCFKDIGISDNKIRDFFDIYIYSKIGQEFDDGLMCLTFQKGGIGSIEIINGQAVLDMTIVSSDSDIAIKGWIANESNKIFPDRVYVGLAQNAHIKYFIKTIVYKNISAVDLPGKDKVDNYVFSCAVPADAILPGEYDMVTISVKVNQAKVLDNCKKLMIKY